PGSTRSSRRRGRAGRAVGSQSAYITLARLPPAIVKPFEASLASITAIDPDDGPGSGMSRARPIPGVRLDHDDVGRIPGDGGSAVADVTGRDHAHVLRHGGREERHRAVARAGGPRVAACR